MRLIRSETYKRIPWKNGGGMLGDIIAAPEGAGLDEFDWRLSTAHVGRDGPFSVFPDIDRVMVILGGTSLRLEIEGRESATLTPGGAPHRFPGDAATQAFLGDGPIDNLNLMVRRGRFDGCMGEQEVGENLRLSPRPGGTVMIFLQTGRAEATDGADRLALAHGDTLVVTSPVTLGAMAPARACIVEVWPV